MSVYKPKLSPFYHYEFQYKCVRFYGSTKCTTEREALKVERRERAKAKAGHSIDKTTINAVWARFWQEKGQHDAQSDVTFLRMETLQDGLAAILKARSRPLTAASIDDDAVSAYVAMRRGQPKRNGDLPTNSSINREVQILRRIMRRARDTWKLVLSLPNWGDLLLPEPDERVVVMSLAREEMLLAEMREDYRATCRFLAMAGPRCGNVFPLPPEAVDFDLEIITLMLKSKKPGGRLFMLPITRAMKILLANEIGKHPLSVFTYIARATRQGKVRGQRYPITYTAFYSEFKRAAKKIGRPDLRPHDLRHIAATRILSKTGNLTNAQKQLGHTRISTTQKYAHVMLDDLRAAMELTHNRTESPVESPGVSEATAPNPMNKKI